VRLTIVIAVASEGPIHLDVLEPLAVDEALRINMGSGVECISWQIGSRCGM